MLRVTAASCLARALWELLRRTTHMDNDTRCCEGGRFTLIFLSPSHHAQVKHTKTTRVLNDEESGEPVLPLTYTVPLIFSYGQCIDLWTPHVIRVIHHTNTPHVIPVNRACVLCFCHQRNRLLFRFSDSSVLVISAMDFLLFFKPCVCVYTMYASLYLDLYLVALVSCTAQLQLIAVTAITKDLLLFLCISLPPSQ